MTQHSDDSGCSSDRNGSLKDKNMIKKELLFPLHYMQAVNTSSQNRPACILQPLSVVEKAIQFQGGGGAATKHLTTYANRDTDGV